MKYLISIYVWIVGFVYFVVFLAILDVLTFLLPREKYDPWIKKSMRLLFKIMLCDVQVSGAEKLDPGKTYLFMANHVSLFDIPLLQAYIPVFFVGVHAAFQFDWPLYGRVLRRMGQIPIARENARASMTSIQRAAEVLRNGTSLAIMPEGYRSLDGNLRPFKRLPFHLAKQAGVDIVPVGLIGVYRLKRKGSWLIRPGRLEVRFGEVVLAEQFSEIAVDGLRAKVREEIQYLIDGDN